MITNSRSESWVIMTIPYYNSEFDIGFFNAKVCSDGSCDSGYGAVCNPKELDINYCGPYNQGRIVLGLGLFMAVGALAVYSLIFRNRQSRTTSYIYVTLISSLIAAICFFITIYSASGIKAVFDAKSGVSSSRTVSYGYPFYLVVVAGAFNILNAGLAAYLVKLSASMAL
ncbi:hypothetical protein HDU76_009255 [Blyttiomyces sp. JEL0837]|nr:hypothetical protein HDU76_009255 [Blyttiomyces sp. JEL0837]